MTIGISGYAVNSEGGCELPLQVRRVLFDINQHLARFHDIVMNQIIRFIFEHWLIPFAFGLYYWAFLYSEL